MTKSKADQKAVFWELFCSRTLPATEDQAEPQTTEISLGLVWGFHLSQIDYDRNIDTSFNSRLVVSLHPRESGPYLEDFSFKDGDCPKAVDDSPFLDIDGIIHNRPRSPQGRKMHSEDFKIIFLDGRIVDTANWKFDRHSTYRMAPVELKSTHPAHLARRMTAALLRQTLKPSRVQP